MAIFGQLFFLLISDNFLRWSTAVHWLVGLWFWLLQEVMQVPIPRWYDVRSLVSLSLSLTLVSLGWKTAKIDLLRDLRTWNSFPLPKETSVVVATAAHQYFPTAISKSKIVLLLIPWKLKHSWEIQHSYVGKRNPANNETRAKMKLKYHCAKAHWYNKRDTLHCNTIDLQLWWERCP